MTYYLTQEGREFIKEGITTGDSPTATGERVGRFLKRLGTGAPPSRQKKKVQQAADIGTRVAQRQGRRHAGGLRTAAVQFARTGDHEGYGEFTKLADLKDTRATLAARRRYDASKASTGLLRTTLR